MLVVWLSLPLTGGWAGILQAIAVIAREEGVTALWKGITPRLMRIMPGQAITFVTYEAVSKHITMFQQQFPAFRT